MAKEYLKRHGACATATGFDNISYATILNIDNDLLVDFVSNCISSPYPPSVFVLTLLIALAKHGKDLHNVNWKLPAQVLHAVHLPPLHALLWITISFLSQKMVFGLGFGQTIMFLSSEPRSKNYPSQPYVAFLDVTTPFR
jgi:hypothetical protein